jgi:hypothetical protein
MFEKYSLLLIAWRILLKQGTSDPVLPFLSYRAYTSLVRSEIGGNPPKSPLRRGTFGLLAPLLKATVYTQVGNKRKPWRIPLNPP